jgi:uncharacterized protein YjbI with pentapeptide repeats
MGRCSYTWKEWDLQKGTYERQCTVSTWEGSDEYCIFHDPSPDKDVDLFKEELKEQMQSKAKKYNFRGYYFPKNWNYFEEREFESNVNFKEATFNGKVSFKNAKFQYADFRESTFSEYSTFNGASFRTANFEEATFRKPSDFNKTIFEEAYFTKAKFRYGDFSEATFKKNGNFGAAKFDIGDFGDAIFENARFSAVTFKSNAIFHRTIFQNAYYTEATFQKNADFNETISKGYISFAKATFQNGEFKDAIFQKVSFDKAVIERILHFAPKQAYELDFRNTQFLFRAHIAADLTQARFHLASLQNVAFANCKWPDNYIIYEEKHMNDEGFNFSFNQLETIYRDLKQTMQNHGDYDTAGELYYREMEMKRKGASKKKKRLWLELYRILAGYGERPQNIVVVSASIVFLFAFLYGASNCLQYSIKNPCIQQKIIDVTYFSFVTFTTLGLGDIAPATTLGKILICLEAVIGAFMIALFVVIFVRKMA